MNKEITFMDLYEIAKEKYNPRIISPFIEAGGVSAAILTEKNNIYTGVCIDTAFSLGMCAEHNAIANMITNGESKIKKLVCYCGKGEEKVGSLMLVDLMVIDKLEFVREEN
jgi:cytidine deaminase